MAKSTIQISQKEDVETNLSNIPGEQTWHLKIATAEREGSNYMQWA